MIEKLGGGGGGSGGSSGTVEGNSWHPTDTNWKVKWEDFNYAIVYTGTGLGELSLRIVTAIVEPALAADGNRHGIISFNTSGTSDGYIRGANSGYYIGGSPSMDLRLGCSVKLTAIPDATNDYKVCFGLNDSLTDVGSGVSLVIDRSVSATHWVAYSKDSTTTTTVTGTAIATSTWFNLEVSINAAGDTAKYYIDGVLVATHTTDIPVGTNALHFGQHGVAGTGNKVYIDWMYAAQKPDTALGSILEPFVTNVQGTSEAITGGDITTTQVIGKSWNPVSTDWKLLWNDFTGAPPAQTGNYWFGDGTAGFYALRNGTGSTWITAAAATADRLGVQDIGIGTSSGAYCGFESSSTDSTFRFGDGRIKVGCALRIIDVPDATNEDYDFCFGVGSNINIFAAENAFWYLDTPRNATNWLCFSNGTASTYNDSGVAFNTNWINLEIDIAADLSSVKYYANGVLKYTETTAANIPVAGTALNYQCTGRSQTTTQVNHFEVDWFYVAIKPTNARGSITTWIDEL